MACDYNFWLHFFRGAGIIPDFDSAYATAFSENRIKADMLLELDRTMLGEMGIIAIGDRLAIIRHAYLVNEKLKLSEFGAADEVPAVEEEQNDDDGDQGSDDEDDKNAADVEVEAKIPLYSSHLTVDTPTLSRIELKDSSAFYSHAASHSSDEVTSRKTRSKVHQVQQEVQSSNPAASPVLPKSKSLNLNSMEGDNCDEMEMNFKQHRGWGRSSPKETKYAPNTEEPPPERVKRVFLFNPPEPKRSPSKSSQRLEFEFESFRKLPFMPNPEFSSSVDDPIVSDNVGFQMLRRMGWDTGGSLGTSNGGIREPLRFKVRAKRMGLGANSFTMQDLRSKRFVNFIPSGIIHSTANPPDC